MMRSAQTQAWEGVDLSTPEGRSAAALEAAQWGTSQGEHHKQWVIDQVVRLLCGCPDVEWVNQSASNGEGLVVLTLGENDAYREWVRVASRAEEREADGSPTYSPWDEGACP